MRSMRRAFFALVTDVKQHMKTTHSEEEDLLNAVCAKRGTKLAQR